MKASYFRLVFLVVFMISSISVFSQTGTLKGYITEELSGDPIIGANVVKAGTTQGVSTNIEGEFTISNLDVGKHTFLVSAVGFATKTLTEITIFSNQSTEIRTSLKEENELLEGIHVTATRSTETEISVLNEIRKSSLVAVGISSEQIKMSQDRDAGQVIRRLSGISILRDRFVNVRGLNERYSTVLLNGVMAPSTEVDSKAFAFDLIPSGMLDRMMVYKSGSAELPSEMAGAVINIFTKNVVDENYFSFSMSGGLRSGTTGRVGNLSSEKVGLDWIGIGDRRRELPQNFPNTNLGNLLSTSNNQSVIAASKSLPNNWGIRNFTSGPDFRLNFVWARKMKIGALALQNITSAGYSKTNQRLNIHQNYYDIFNPDLEKSSIRYDYNDDRFTLTNRFGVISNFALQINPQTRLEWRNFYNQQGKNSSTQRKGVEPLQGFEVKNRALKYYARRIYSSQLAGDHNFSESVDFDWVLGYNHTNANQPDYRRIRSQKRINKEEDFSIVIPPTSSSIDAGRFYSKLKEQTFSVVANIGVKLNPSQTDEDKQRKLIGGIYMERKKRAFSARWMSYRWINSTVIKNSLLKTSFDKLFTPENVGNHFILDEGTNETLSNNDRYDGNNQLMSTFLSFEGSLGNKFKISTGMRLEYNLQEIDVYVSGNIRQQVVSSPSIAPMPFLNLSYDYSTRGLVRLAYSKTINRPVFRELAPFNYYDFDRNSDIFGNPDLIAALIHNIDVRWEFYPSITESISFGLFYKKFINPIEQYLELGSNLRYGFLNAKDATTYGLEIELKKSLEGLTTSKILDKLSFSLNGALINSAIVLPDEKENLDRNRAMQGQSPYIFNASVFFTHPTQGWRSSIQYNVFGKRIVAVGDNDQNPTQYEMPRNQIDLTVTKQIGDNIQISFGIKDLLNQPFRLIQDSDRNGKINSIDESIQTYKMGQYTTIGFNWRFN